MRKGDETRDAILEESLAVATQLGLEGLTIGKLAENLHLSKSGLFRHFGSKQALQVETLTRAAEHFRERVIRPSLAAPRGEPRLRALFDHWLEWPDTIAQQGGCIWVAAAVELDDRPGPARDALARLIREFLDFVAGAVQLAIDEGHLRADVDPEQFTFEMYGIVLVWHQTTRLQRDHRALERAHRAFESLLAANRTTEA